YASYADDIHISGRHLLSMIDDLLDLSKAEAGRMELFEGKVDIAATAAEALRMLEIRARQAEVELRGELPANLPAVRADERKMLQVYLNLASNAVKFTPAGGEVVLGAGLKTDGALWIAVRDSGIGMSPSDIARALEPFGQIDNLYNKRHVGT